MKKYIALILSIMMIFALCACGGSDTEAPDETKTPDAVEGADDEGGAQVSNPMKEVSAEELSAAVGIELSAPEGATDVKTFTIAGSVGELQFDYKGIHYCYRTMKSDSYQDISGIYISTGSNYASAASLMPVASSATLTVDSNVNIAVDEDGARGVATWYDDGYSYSVSIEKGATSDLLMSMYKLLTA